nr:hypothetical protein [Tanacetum cinerariifolium]
MEYAKNQDDGKVDEHAVNSLLKHENDSQFLTAFMEVDPIFNPADVDVDVEKEMKVRVYNEGSYKDVYEELGRLGCKVEVLEGCEWSRLTLEDRG